MDDQKIWFLLQNWKFVTKKKYNDNDKLFAINVYNKNINYVQNNYKCILNEIVINECFIIASQSIEIMDLLFQEFKIDINYLNPDKQNCLMCACANKSMKNVKHIIKYFTPDINSTSNEGISCLMFLCQYELHISNIKWYVELFNHTIMNVDNSGMNCLMHACRHNSNVLIIKYLIEIVLMDVNAIDLNGDNCFDHSIKNKFGLEISNYLIRNTKANISINKVKINKYKKIINHIQDDIVLFEKIIKIGFLVYSFVDMINLHHHAQPLLMTENMRKIANLADPFDDDFEDYIQNVDKINHKISLDVRPMEVKTNHNFEIISDFRNINEILFKYNGETYYGSKKIVYNSIIFLKEIMNDESFKFDDLIILSTSAIIPSYLINLWIFSSYTRRFDINSVNKEDFVSFIKFIDQYPMDCLSIDQIDNSLVVYMEEHKIVPDDYLVSICMKYKLKVLYLLIHNNKIKKLY